MRLKVSESRKEKLKMFKIFDTNGKFYGEHADRASAESKINLFKSMAPSKEFVITDNAAQVEPNLFQQLAKAEADEIAGIEPTIPTQPITTQDIPPITNINPPIRVKNYRLYIEYNNAKDCETIEFLEKRQIDAFIAKNNNVIEYAKMWNERKPEDVEELINRPKQSLIDVVVNPKVEMLKQILTEDENPKNKAELIGELLIELIRLLKE